MNHQTQTLIAKLEQQLASIYKTTIEQQQVAWWLLQALTGFDVAHILTKEILELSDDQENKLNEWIRLHTIEQKPLQYILGTVPFGSLSIIVEPPTLIPRPETEEWALHIINLLKKLKDQHLTILDLCTGSGCIALLLAKELPASQLIATDLADSALSCAHANAKANRLQNVTIIKSDLYNDIEPRKQFDLIVSNPPYIAAQEWKHLDPMVANWEDRNALVSEHGGLAHIEEIIKKAPLYLKQNNQMKELMIPQLIIEIGYRQGNSVKELMRKALFEHVEIWKDLEGKDRAVCARMPL
ncbi:MAG TPA: peptide chain release factor N(5)-glutamine methyltransferase [Candidatus Babeliales bacterium]|nr:peptide chain release factor N(5)-glutamine methyltransferase [Candidatus Babeliales bacterium]